MTTVVSQTKIQNDKQSSSDPKLNEGTGTLKTIFRNGKRSELVEISDDDEADDTVIDDFDGDDDEEEEEKNETKNSGAGCITDTVLSWFPVSKREIARTQCGIYSIKCQVDMKIAVEILDVVVKSYSGKDDPHQDSLAFAMNMVEKMVESKESKVCKNMLFVCFLMHFLFCVVYIFILWSNFRSLVSARVGAFMES